MAMLSETLPPDQYVKRFEVVPPGAAPQSTTPTATRGSKSKASAMRYAKSGMNPN